MVIKVIDVDKFFERYDYEKGKYLGAGGQGIVRSVYDRRRKHFVALKEFDATSATSAESFRREYEILTRLRNVPHVLRLYDAFRLSDGDRSMYLSLELFEGDSIANLLKQYRGQSIHVTHLLRVAHEGLKALAALHKRGVVHGDVKAENFLYNERQGTLLIDFGVSCFTTTKKKKAPASVQCKPDNAAYGTFLFFSPDRVRIVSLLGSGLKFSVDAFFKIMRKDDLFAFGCMLCSMILDQEYLPPPLYSEAQMNAAFRDPAYMIPSDFAALHLQHPDSPIITLVVNLLLSTYKERPSAQQALKILGADRAASHSPVVYSQSLNSVTTPKFSARERSALRESPVTLWGSAGDLSSGSLSLSAGGTPRSFGVKKRLRTPSKLRQSLSPGDISLLSSEGGGSALSSGSISF